MFTHTEKLSDCHESVLNPTSPTSPHTNTDIGEHRHTHTERLSSVWEAHAAAGYDGKHPTLPPTPHRQSCHCDIPGAADSPKAVSLQSLDESDLFISSPAFKQLHQPNREAVDSAQLVPKQ